MPPQVETAFYVGKRAWHGVGNVLDFPPSTMKEGMVASGLDWVVEEQPIFTRAVDGTFRKEKTHKAIIRVKDQTTLGIVGSDYQPVQNLTAFEFFDPFIQSGLVQFEAAASLQKGKRIFILAKIKSQTAEILTGDPIVGYFLLYSSHDGTLSIGVQFTAIRVECNNMLGQAILRGETGMEKCVRIRHTLNAEEALKVVQQTVDIANRTFSITTEAFQAMARKNLGIDGLEKFVKEVLKVEEPIVKEDGTVVEPKIPRAFDKIMEAHEKGAGALIPGVQGTLWGALNAVTHYIDHTRGRTPETRLDASMFGAGKTMRNRAMELALAQVAA